MGLKRSKNPSPQTTGRTLTGPGRLVVGSLADRAAQLTQVGLEGHEVIAL